jgi:hypothetical protein
MRMVRILTSELAWVAELADVFLTEPRYLKQKQGQRREAAFEARPVEDYGVRCIRRNTRKETARWISEADITLLVANAAS